MGLISLQYIPDFRHIHEALRALGINTEKYYRDLNIRERDFNSTVAGVMVPSYLELLNLIAKQEQRPILGVEIAEVQDVTNLGTFGYLARNAPDFGRCLKLIESYIDMVMPGACTKIIEEGDHTIWTYEIEGYPPSRVRQEIEMTLMQFINAIRELLCLPDWRPQDVYFQHASPQSVELLQSSMATHLTFDHYFNGVRFPNDFLLKTISNADPKLLLILEQQIEQSISKVKTGDSLINRIEFIFLSNIGHNNVSAESLAKTLCMSRRTLHRHLSKNGTSIQTIRDNLIARLAKDALCNTQVSVTVLAQQLGYSDTSAFNHAFKRTTGFCPSEYRLLHN